MLSPRPPSRRASRGRIDGVLRDGMVSWLVNDYAMEPWAVRLLIGYQGKRRDRGGRAGGVADYEERIATAVTSSGAKLGRLARSRQVCLRWTVQCWPAWRPPAERLSTIANWSVAGPVRLAGVRTADRGCCGGCPEQTRSRSRSTRQMVDSQARIGDIS